VHGALGEQGEDGGANVTATSPWAASTTAAAVTEAATARELLAIAAMPGMAWVSV
jgi:hypothetical protein